MKRVFWAIPALLAATACQREAAAPQPPQPGATPPEPSVQVPETPPEAVPELKDVVETDPRYIIGITYPPEANKYPGLAAELKRYVDAARAELMQAVEGNDAQPGSSALYDLSLVFSTVVDTPDIIAIAADGSSYTGGAHGAPLVARFVWLPRENRLLRAGELLPDARAWRDVSDFVREQLHAALSQRVDADELEPAERERIIRSGGRMIDEGSEPEVANFEQFEPVLGADGRIAALRFVFPPYQVGPYSDGVQTVEVPARVLLPHVADAYKGLFSDA